MFSGKLCILAEMKLVFDVGKSLITGIQNQGF